MNLNFFLLCQLKIDLGIIFNLDMDVLPFLLLMERDFKAIIKQNYNLPLPNKGRQINTFWLGMHFNVGVIESQGDKTDEPKTPMDQGCLDWDPLEE